MISLNGETLDRPDANGVIIEPSEEQVLAELAGYPEQSVYTSVRTYGREPWRLDEHLQRLEASAKLKGLSLPRTIDEIRQWVFELLTLEYADEENATGRPERFIKIVATPHDIVINSRKLEIDPKIYDGVTVTIHPLIRPQVKAKSADVSEQTKACEEAQAKGCYEALLLNEEKNVLTEGSRSNVLWIKDGILYWCDEALSGITQGDVLKLAAELGIPTQQAELHVDEIWDLDEMFLTQTSRGIVPVTAIHDAVKIRDGIVGPLTRRLMTAFAVLTRQPVDSHL